MFVKFFSDIKKDLVEESVKTKVGNIGFLDNLFLEFQKQGGVFDIQLLVVVIV